MQQITRRPGPVGGTAPPASADPGLAPGPASPPRRPSPVRRWLRRIWPGAIVTVGVLLVAGCISEPAPEETGGISTASFIDVVVALREAEREAVRTDSAPAVFARRKEEILSEHGVTPDQLRAYVERHRNDFVLMDAVWDSIARRLRYVPEDASSGRELHVEQIR